MAKRSRSVWRTALNAARSVTGTEFRGIRKVTSGQRKCTSCRVNPGTVFNSRHQWVCAGCVVTGDTVTFRRQRRGKTPPPTYERREVRSSSRKWQAS